MLKNATVFNPESQALERIESFKAGAIAAISCVSVAISLRLIHQAGQIEQLLSTGAIAALSGFLFGITYRYVIRNDANLQLKSGAVIAFGLVRGLGQVELQLSDHSLPLISLALPLAESLLWFILPQILLEACLAKGWLKFFNQGQTNE